MRVFEDPSLEVIALVSEAIADDLVTGGTGAGSFQMPE